MPKDVSNDSPDESVETQHELEENELEPEFGDSEASTEDSAQPAFIKRYGFTKQQAKESKLFL